jgi:hypothetical protein
MLLRCSMSEQHNDSRRHNALFLDHYARLKLSLQDIGLVTHSINGRIALWRRVSHLVQH